MNQIIFATDLDNTIIYSHKKATDKDVCVEILNGKKQSYIPCDSVDLLLDLSRKITFVPITTRSTEQYQQIKFPTNTRIGYSFVANGGILLNSEYASNWNRNSKRIYSVHGDELKKWHDLLVISDDYLRCRIVDNQFLYIHCKEHIDAYLYAAKFNCQTNLEVIASGRKIYFFAPEFNKGSAIEFIKKIAPDSIIISAGDSHIDLPMLEKADYAIAPYSLASEIINPNTIISSENDNYVSFVINTLAKLVNQLNKR